MSWNLDYTFSGASSVLNSWASGLSTFYSQESDFNGMGPFDPNNNSVNEISNFMTAATTLTQWWDLNRIGNYNGPGTSRANPYEVPFSENAKSNIVSSLGSNAESTALWNAYYDKTKYNSAVGNTYFNLNSDPRYGGVAFQDNKLVIYDVYNFEGIGDWGTAPTESLDKARLSGDLVGMVKSPDFLPWLIKTIGVIVVMAPAGTVTALIRQLVIALGFDPTTGQFADGTPISSVNSPYVLYTRDFLNLQIGNLANLYIRNEFTAEEVCKWNPALYRDAVSKGYLQVDAEPTGSCSQIGAQADCFDATNNVVPVGQAQPIPLLGFPYYAPRVMEISSTNPTSWQVGSNDKYPSPFTSYIQQTYNTANYLGPYAMWGPIAGRICQIRSGSNFGEPGFIAQCWDVFDDTPNNVDADGERYSSKLEWWNSCEYAYVEVRNLLFSGQPPTLVKVAVKSFSGPAADDVWGPNYQPSESPFGTVSLGTLIPLVALTSRYF